MCLMPLISHIFNNIQSPADATMLFQHCYNVGVKIVGTLTPKVVTTSIFSLQYCSMVVGTSRPHCVNAAKIVAMLYQQWYPTLKSDQSTML